MPRLPHACPGCGGSTWGELCQGCRRARNTRPCENCGEVFTAKDRRQRFCKLTCHQAATKCRTCDVCGADYAYTYFKQRTCSRECGAELRRRIYGFAGKGPKGLLDGPTYCRVYHRNCTECGVLFVARRAYRLTCGEKCARRRLISQVLDRHYGYAANGLRGGSLIEYLKVRDHNRCGICHKPVRAKSGPRGPSPDHIIPRSRWEGPGSPDVLSNLQLSHLDCNWRKNNRGGGEQLLLVG